MLGTFGFAKISVPNCLQDKLLLLWSCGAKLYNRKIAKKRRRTPETAVVGDHELNRPANHFPKEIYSRRLQNTDQKIYYL